MHIKSFTTGGSFFRGSWKNWFHFTPWLRLLAPSIGPIGGLEISDSHIRFFDIRKGQVYSVGLRIPPGIIYGGKVLNKEKLLSVLREIRKELGFSQKKRRLNIIVTLPPEVVYLQAFSLPYLTGENLKSAANLNLQIMSPIPYEDTYHDWQMIGEGLNNQLEVLSIFAEKNNVETIVLTCEAGGFVVVAVEPAIFSLARMVKEIGRLDMKEPHIVLSAGDAGMNFAGIKNNAVYFNYFISWQSIYGDASEISKKIFEENIVQYVGKVLTFFASHGHADMKRLLLITSSFRESFKDIIERNFPLEVKNVAFGEFDRFGADWATVIGAYVRGRLPRAEDTLVSLSGLSTREEFTQYQILHFFSIWRNVIGVVLAFLLAIYGGTYLFIQRVASEIQLQPREALRAEDLKELKALQTSAIKFNTLTSLVGKAELEKKEIAHYFKKILDVADTRVSVKRIYLQSLSAPIIISGDASGEQAIINFKNRLGNDEDFIEVNLPLTSLLVEGDHTTFSITLRLKPISKIHPPAL